METEVTCPDCGKLIAAPGAVDSALRCRCAENRAPRISPDYVPTRPKISVPISVPQPPLSPSGEEAPASSSNDDTDGLETATATSGSSSSTKNCYICGADLAGRTRLKDHLGRYWCKQCAAADERAKRRENELRCADCSRVFPAHKLQYFQTHRVCATCYKAREKELERKIVKANAAKVHKSHEFGKLKWMAIIAGGLILLATIFQLAR